MKQESKGKKEAVRAVEDPVPSNEHLELLVSDKYELTRPIPVRVHRYDDGSVLVDSPELNLYAEGDSDYEAISNFSEILVEQLEDLNGFLDEGKKLGRVLRIQLSLLERLLRRI